MNNFDYIIDVRSVEEYNDEHIENSINIPVDQIGNTFESTPLVNIDKNSKILLVCRSGGRAGLAEMILLEKGFTNVENGGGYTNWL